MKKTFKLMPLILFGAITFGCVTLSSPNIQATTTPPPPTEVSAPTSVAPPTEAEIIEGIQTTLAAYAKAYHEGDEELLASILDLENKPFSRFIKTRFKSVIQSFNGSGPLDTYQVDSITQREHGLIQAHIIYNEVAAVDWTFRQLEDGRWVLTEPTVEQTGKAEVKDTQYFQFKTYPWADDVNDKVEELTQNARDYVKGKLGKVPEDKAEVEIIPTYGLYPFDDPNAVAYYSQNGSLSGKGDRIVIYAPHSYLFGWYYVNIGWEAELENILIHEYTHMTHTRSFNDAGKLADWIVEGLAEYVDGVNRAYVVAEALNKNALVPLVDTTPGVVQKQDLAHIRILEKDVSLAYAEAESLVAFIVEEKGGFEAFWKFANAYTGDLDKALQSSLGISQSEFEIEWQNWLKDTYLPKYAN